MIEFSITIVCNLPTIRHMFSRLLERKVNYILLESLHEGEVSRHNLQIAIANARKDRNRSGLLAHFLHCCILYARAAFVHLHISALTMWHVSKHQ